MRVRACEQCVVLVFVAEARYAYFKNTRIGGHGTRRTQHGLTKSTEVTFSCCKSCSMYCNAAAADATHGILVVMKSSSRTCWDALLIAHPTTTCWL